MSLNPLTLFGLLSRKPTAPIEAVTLLPEASLETEPLDKGPNAAARNVAGRALVEGVTTKPSPLSGTASQYLSGDEAYKLNKAEEREPKDLATIRDLTIVALRKKKAFEKADENGLSKRLFKDIAPYYLPGCKFSETLTVEQCIRNSSVTDLDHILLAACKLRIAELAGSDCKKEERDYSSNAKIISYKDPSSRADVPLRTLTLEKAIFDLKLYEDKLTKEINRTRDALEQREDTPPDLDFLELK